MNRSRAVLHLEVLEDRCVPDATALPIASLTAGGVTWGGQDPATGGIGFFSQDGVTHFAILDASQPLTNGTFQNAYNGAFGLTVNGIPFANNFSGTVDLTGTTITSSTQNLSGLDTSVQYFFDPASPTVRALFSFTNSTTADIQATVQWDNNFDTPDGDVPVVIASSDGNSQLDGGDRWFIARTASTSGPFLDWVRFGPGSPLAKPSGTPSIPGQGTTPSTFTDQFDLTVPAGQTVRLMFFGQVVSNSTEAVARTTVFNGNDFVKNAGLLTGLSQDQLNEIANWDLNPAPTITSAAVAGFAVGRAGSFTITTSGMPAPTLSLSGILPAGITFNDNLDGTATLSGTPVFGTEGIYNLTLDASNGAGTDGSQALSLTVARAPSSRFMVLGADGGGQPRVKVLNVDGSTQFNFLAYDTTFQGGVRVAAADVTGDGIPDIVTGTGPGIEAQVKVFDGATGVEVLHFNPYPGFSGGVFVAAGDVNADGRADIITGTDVGAGPHVKVFNGADNSLLASFYAYDPAFLGGVRVAAGDINGDGRDDIITGAGPGAGPHVKVFDATTLATRRSFFVHALTYRGGVYVAAGDTNGDGRDEIITSPATAGRAVKVFNMSSVDPPLRFFIPAGFTMGMRVGAVDFDGDGLADVIAGSSVGQNQASVLQGSTLAPLDHFFMFDGGFLGGAFVAGSRNVRVPLAVVS